MGNRTALVVPTYNAGNDFEEVIERIYKQKKSLDIIKIYDSESSDSTVKIAKSFGIEVEVIPKNGFSHSMTRSRIAQEMYDAGFDYLIFMTQDVYLQDKAIENLQNFIMNNSDCGVAYGKQEVNLKVGTLFEYFARSFNYGDRDLVKSKEDIKTLGIKTIFNSDAFAIYNLKTAKIVGFFGNQVSFSEDMVIAHKFIENGYKVGYCSTAKVFHTHNYSLSEEYRRYKIIGQFHRDQKEMIERYGKTNSEGLKLALEEVKFLKNQREIRRLPESLARNAAKFIGMKMGYYK